VTDFTGGVRSHPAAAPDSGRAETWRDQAACRTADPRLFDLRDREEGIEPPETAHDRYRRAFNHCRVCPVADECLAEALRNFSSGVNGGHLLDTGRLIREPLKTGRTRPRKGRAA
jgi:hypothetical protein